MNSKGNIVTYFDHLKREILFDGLLANSISPKQAFHLWIIGKLKKLNYIDVRASTQFIDPTFKLHSIPAQNLTAALPLEIFFNNDTSE